MQSNVTGILVHQIDVTRDIYSVNTINYLEKLDFGIWALSMNLCAINWWKSILSSTMPQFLCINTPIEHKKIDLSRNHLNCYNKPKLLLMSWMWMASVMKKRLRWRVLPIYQCYHLPCRSFFYQITRVLNIR